MLFAANIVKIKNILVCIEYTADFNEIKYTDSSNPGEGHRTDFIQQYCVVPAN